VCPTHDIELVFTPSKEFTALRYFTLDGSDYPAHAAQETAIARYIRWANRRAPKRHYAQLQDPQTRLPTQRCVT
jgi:hypothetical protein